MSRARNIKPGFFKNDRLAECDPLARILFAALWCEADREGRLEDRPKRIKAECLPYDDADADALLAQLAKAGFILRYEVGGERFIAILNFSKHQNPHVREPASSIPGPGSIQAPGETVQGRENHESAQGKHSASTGQAPGEHGTGPADSPFLIPDSSKEPPQPPASGGRADDDEPKAKSLASITADAVAAFNASRLVKANGGMLAGVNPSIGRELRQRQVSRSVKLAREIADEMGTALDREWWDGYFDACFADDFIAGRRSGGRDHSNWIADFEYLLRPKTVDQVYRRAASEAA